MPNDSAVEDRVDTNVPAEAAETQPALVPRARPLHLDVGRLYYQAIGRTDAQYFIDVKVIGETLFPEDDDCGGA